MRTQQVIEQQVQQYTNALMNRCVSSAKSPGDCISDFRYCNAVGLTFEECDAMNGYSDIHLTPQVQASISIKQKAYDQRLDRIQQLCIDTGYCNYWLVL